MGDNKDSWIKELRSRLSQPLNRCTSGKGQTIFKVPHALLSDSKEAYVPQRVSFGPYHSVYVHGGDRLREMEDYKENTVQSGQILISLRSHEKSLDYIADLLTREEINNIRTCYGIQDGSLSAEGLAWVVTLDATFLLEWMHFVLQHHNGTTHTQTEKALVVNNQTFSWDEMLKDLVKLENQIPHFVMKLIFDIAFGGSESPVSMKLLVSAACLYLSPFPEGPREVQPSGHILETLHTYILGSKPECSTKKQAMLPSAVELSDAGVKFVPCSGTLAGIKFVKKTCTFHIPKFIVNDTSEVTMRNLIALEMCSPSLKRTKAVTSYSHMMNSLIQSEADVQLLKRNHIIGNYLGSDQKVVGLWRSLTNCTMKPLYDPIDNHVHDLVGFYKTRKWRRYMGEYKRKKCSRPWFVVSGLAAALLLFMTFLQVFCLFYDSCLRKSSKAKS